MKTVIIFILQMSVFSYTEITFPMASDRVSVWTRFLLCALALVKLPEGTDFQTSLCPQRQPDLTSDKERCVNLPHWNTVRKIDFFQGMEGLPFS